MFDLTTQEIMMLIAIAAKACEYKQEFVGGLHQGGKTFEMSQVESIIDQTIKVLVEIDRANPGVVPVPHDGLSWKDRVE